jgi:flagellar biosynthesis GTPase FlhF
VEHTWDGDGRTIALVGPREAGRSLAAARLSSAYARCPGGAATLSLESSTEEAGRKAAALRDEHRVVVVDTPALSLADPGSFSRTAHLVAAARPDEVHVVLPATCEALVARGLLDALEGQLRVDRILLTRLDETRRAPALLGLAMERGLPVSYVSTGDEREGTLRPADPALLAGLAMP